jgi:hypothetical protein
MNGGILHEGTYGSPMLQTKGDLPLRHSLANGAVSQYVSRNRRGSCTGCVDGHPVPKFPKLEPVA